MSTSPRADGGQSALTELHEEQAEHLGEQFAPTMVTCRNTISANHELSYLAHYSSGVFDFSIDRLGESPRPSDALPGGTRRDESQRLGRALSFTANRLDRKLQEVRTGGLIRTVLHTEDGAAFCNSVVPKENVVGFVLDRPVMPALDGLLSHTADVQSADIAMVRLATYLRKQISLASSNPGGWETANDIDPMTATGSPAEPFVTSRARTDERAAPLTDACRQAVRSTDLHLVAYCVSGEVAYMADYLEHQSLGSFFTQITATARRQFYQEFSRELGELATTLGRTIRRVLGGLLVRMVLDVEQGAIYYYRLGTGTYLVGVTINQSRVSNADDQMSRLAFECQHLVAG